MCGENSCNGIRDQNRQEVNLRTVIYGDNANFNPFNPRK